MLSIHNKQNKRDYLGAENKEVAEIFLVLSGSNLLPTASVGDGYCCLQLACGNPQFHTCNMTPTTV